MFDCSNKSINISLIEYIVEKDKVTIQFRNYSLIVDTSLLGPFPHQKNCFIQFIGELEEPKVYYSFSLPLIVIWLFYFILIKLKKLKKVPFIPDVNTCSLILKARVSRVIDSLDFNVFEQALQIRTKFEKERIEQGIWLFEHTLQRSSN